MQTCGLEVIRVEVYTWKLLAVDDWTRLSLFQLAGSVDRDGNET